MHIPKSIRSNLRFLLIEICTQLKQLQNFLEDQSISVAYRIINRAGYASNLATRIQNACTLQISQGVGTDNMTMSAVASIAADLEKIMDLNCECIHQMGYLERRQSIDLTVHNPFISKVLKSLGLIEESLFTNDTRLALKLARTEGQLDSSYKKLLSSYTRKLKKKKNTEDLVTALFIAHNIEQMGDALLSISEAIISSNIGQPMDMQSYQLLRGTVSHQKDDPALAEMEVKRLADTRSGSGISSVNYRDQDENQQLVVFKNGEKRKLKEEVDGVERWHRTFPGVAPQILRYRKEGKSAALLIEHLHGMTFEQVVIKGSGKTRHHALIALKKTLFSVWGSTRKEQKAPAGFVKQIRKRLQDIYAVHPDFKTGCEKICGYEYPGLEKRLEWAEKLERKVPAPFSVFIHGDFNVDNVIYDPEENTIRFIDLHRSSYLDYVQDVSVFMVSNVRLQVLAKPVRQRIREQVFSFYEIARKFASKHNDNTFEIRLTLGLARSLLTSTRFILDQTVASRMFLKANFLLDQVLGLKAENYPAYRNPILEIFSD